MTKEDISNLLNDDRESKDSKINTMMYAIFNINDWQWLQNLCMQMAKYPEEDIAGLALTGLGHVARMFRKMDIDIVIPFLKDLINNDEYLSGRAQDALDDIEIFI